MGCEVEEVSAGCESPVVVGKITAWEANVGTSAVRDLAAVDRKKIEAIIRAMLIPVRTDTWSFRRILPTIAPLQMMDEKQIGTEMARPSDRSDI